MTTFTRVIVDARHPSCYRALGSLERMHAIVARAVSDGVQETGSVGEQRHLWRLDKSANGTRHRLYIVASAVPDYATLSEQLGVASGDVDSAPYEPMLNRLECGQEWGFRLTANPTRSEVSRIRGVRGKREGIVGREEQSAWLFAQGLRHGFHMPVNRLEVPEVVVCRNGNVSFRRKSTTVTLSTAEFNGVLAVDDPDELRAALVNGIGRAKGYGFGLLTLLPLPGRTYGKGAGGAGDEGR